MHMSAADTVPNPPHLREGQELVCSTCQCFHEILHQFPVLPQENLVGSFLAFACVKKQSNVKVFFSILLTPLWADAGQRIAVANAHLHHHETRWANVDNSVDSEMPPGLPGKLTSCQLSSSSAWRGGGTVAP